MKALGVGLFALSPDEPAAAKETRAETGVGFPLLSDRGLELAAGLGIAFRNPDGPPLPVPSVFLVAKGGTVAYQHVDPDFRVRLDNGIILAMAASLVK